MTVSLGTGILIYFMVGIPFFIAMLGMEHSLTGHPDYADAIFILIMKGAV